MIARLLGFDHDVTFFHFYLRHPWPGIVVIGCVLAALIFAAVLYRRETGLTRGRKVVLATLRAVLLAVIVVLLFEPALGMEQNTKIHKSLICLVDVSESMSLADARKNTRDIEEAALSLGAAKAYDPAVQQKLASAVRLMERAAGALERKAIADALFAQESAGKALAEVSAKFGSATTAPADGKSVETLKDIQKRLEALRAQTAEAQKPEQAARIIPAELAAEQLRMAGQVDAVLAELVEHAVTSVEDQSKVQATPRLDLAVALLKGPLGETFKQVGDDYTVRFFRFGDGLDPSKGLGETTGDFKADTKALAANTRLGWAIEEAVARYSGQPIGGVVLLTDGGSNAGQDPLEVARRMKERGVPLYPIGIGVPLPENAAITGVLAPDVIFQKDEVPVRVQVTSHGYAKRRADVSIMLDGKQVAGKNIELQEGAQFEELGFKPEGKSGDVRMEVVLSPMPGQINTDGNKAGKTIRIIDEKIKVLYLEGRPRWEYRYLRAILKRDYRLDVKFVMTEGDPDLAANSQEYLAHFPEESPEAFKWDSIIIGDVKKDFFTPAQLEKIEKAVKERGGSLIFLAGEQNPLTAYAQTPLADMLPVMLRPDGERWEKLEDTVHPVVTDAGRQSLIMDLEAGSVKGLAKWDEVKPLYEVPALAGAKPGATVLAELSDKSKRSEPYPLISWQRYGAGKVMLIGSDQFWRLRLKTGDKYHARFWGQTLQFMALSHLLAGSKPVSIEVDRKQYNTGDDVHLYVNVMNESFEPVVQPSYTVALERVDGQDRRDLKLEPVKSANGKGNTPGLYQGYFRAERDGRFRVNVNVQGKDPKALANPVEFDVLRVSPEMAQPEMHEDLLRKMAELSGGRYLSARDVAALPGYLEGESSTVLVRTERELWDVWPVFALILALAGLEWYLRRRSDLV